MKRTLAVAAVAVVLALFALTGQAAAQDGPSLEADPPAVAGPGSQTFTITGSGWNSGLLVYIVPCTLAGDQLTTASSADEIAAAMGAMASEDCERIPIGGPQLVGADGTFTVEVTYDVPANFVIGAGDANSVQDGAVPILFVADDMGDGMVPNGGADTGFGGMAGSDPGGAAVPLAATLAAVILLGGTALVARRNN